MVSLLVESGADVMRSVRTEERISIGQCVSGMTNLQVFLPSMVAIFTKGISLDGQQAIRVGKPWLLQCDQPECRI